MKRLRFALIGLALVAVGGAVLVFGYPIPGALVMLPGVLVVLYAASETND
jgi:uncharacterized membrane protein